MSLAEALSAIHLLVNMAPAKRLEFSRGLVRYFFMNAMEIRSCPFLRGDSCLIYDDRFFGCRAYGLWSDTYYEEQAARSRKAKRMNNIQWQRWGISLPQEVVEFSVPNCPYVEVEENGKVDDRRLLHILDTVTAISEQLAPWHESFRDRYFSDLSFLLASLSFGLNEAIKLKFEIIRDCLSGGRMDRLVKVIEKLPDFCEGFE